MARERYIGRLSEIPVGEGRTYEVEGRRVAVFRTRAGQVFATQAECPHRGGPLADGLIGGATVVCPLHDWAYDLATGKALAGDCDIEIYPVRVAEDGAVLLTLSPAMATTP